MVLLEQRLLLLTDLIARTSGMSVADFPRKRLFEPLGMKTTVYSEGLRDVIKKRPLVHVSGATFSAADSPITLTFTLSADGRATWYHRESPCEKAVIVNSGEIKETC